MDKKCKEIMDDWLLQILKFIYDFTTLVYIYIINYFELFLDNVYNLLYKFLIYMNNFFEFIYSFVWYLTPNYDVFLQTYIVPFFDLLFDLINDLLNITYFILKFIKQIIN
jgi:hypothetical protein